MKAEVVWHDVECGGYAADLALWEELAGRAEAPILDLGCGTGRVSLHLARRGHEVRGLDRDPALVEAYNRRAEGLPATAEVGDARGFALGTEFGLVLAPMQLVQLFAGPAERIACLRSVAAHLQPGGAAAFAIAEGVLGGVNADPGGVAPDAREVNGHLYTSLPLETKVARDTITIRRRRKLVSPEGVLVDEVDQVVLSALSADGLDQEGQGVKLRAMPRREIEPTADHVGSTIVLLEREA